MIVITDKGYQPDIAEIGEFIGNPLFNEFYSYICDKYSALVSVEYSGDNILLGWNVRFRSSGRALCRLYPKQGFSRFLL